MDIRRLGPDEIDLHRRVRLHALQDAPASFGETFAEVAGRPSAYWEKLTRSVTEAERQVMFLACEGENVLGCVYGLVDRERGGSGHVGGMWVTPAARRRGVGRALLDAVITWARGRRFEQLGLWAPAGVAAALALYGKAGFEETGVRSTMPLRPTHEIVEMVLRL